MTRGRTIVVSLVVLAVGVGATVFLLRDRDAPGSPATAAAAPSPAAITVDLVSPKPATQGRVLTLPADIEAFYTAPIHSRVNGYVRMWYYDIGAKVKAGAVLARIETPELDQRSEQARSEVAKAQADLNLANLTADRWKALRPSQSVSQQTAAEKTGDAQARLAEVKAAQANLDRIKALQNFREIVAPFDGTITQRNIDVGALVSATDSAAKPLFELATNREMRAYVSVPQIYTWHMGVGTALTLKLPQYPGKRFTGRIETTSDSIAQSSRALLMEAIFPNPDGQLSPGAYAEAQFELPLDPHVLTLPSSAMLFRGKSPEVAVIEKGKVVLKTVRILLDTGSEIEVGGALTPDDKVVASPSDAIEDGDAVKVETIDGVSVGAEAGEEKSASAK